MAVSAVAQDDSTESSKTGAEILPQKGDFALGMDATPVLNYLGNIFNNTSSNNLSFGTYTIGFKYQVQDNRALRSLVYINNSTNIDKQYVQDDAAVAQDPLSTDEVIRRVKKFADKKYDYVFTHGKSGEYGHKRHLLVHNAVKEMIDKKILSCKRLFFFSYVKKGEYAYTNKNADKFIKLNTL